MVLGYEAAAVHGCCNKHTMHTGCTVESRPSFRIVYDFINGCGFSHRTDFAGVTFVHFAVCARLDTFDVINIGLNDAAKFSRRLKKMTLLAHYFGLGAHFLIRSFQSNQSHMQFL